MPEGKKVSTMFSSIAGRYDLANFVLSGGVYILWQRALFSAVDQLLPDKERRAAALDVCTGTGALLPGLMKRFRMVTGLDFCAEMLDVAKKEYGNAKSLTLIQGDALKLPFENRSFDAVTVAYGVRNLENAEAGLREMKRVLKPGGVVFVLEFGKPPANMWGRLYRWYSSVVLPRLGGFLTGNKAAYGYLKETSQEFPAGDDFLMVCESAGFEACSAKSLSGGIAWLYTGKAPAK